MGFKAGLEIAQMIQILLSLFIDTETSSGWRVKNNVYQEI